MPHQIVPIDWTKPLETVELKPRNVRVLDEIKGGAIAYMGAAP